MAKWKQLVLLLSMLLVWVMVALFGAFRGWWMASVVDQHDVQGFFDYAVGTLQKSHQGASALVLIHGGEVVRQYYASPDDSVDADTVFAAASASKWLAAFAMMTLVEMGQAELDTPVSQYLTRWQLPDSEFNNDGVTIRRLLSHTAGLGDGLGFGEYAADEPVPELEDELSNPRASSGRKVSIAVTAEPGSEWKYSGGSYLLIELLIEELTGKSYEDYVQEAVFEPLHMTRAGYNLLDSYTNNAGLYATNGEKVLSVRYASSAATGLVISSDDLVRFVLFQINPRDSKLIGKNAIETMRTPHGHLAGAPIWGLGTILYAATEESDFVYGHDGANDPAVNVSVRINPNTGDAFVALLSGHPSIATNIGSEWVLWQTGYPDVLVTKTVLQSATVPLLAGSVLIILVFAASRYRRRKNTVAVN